MNIQQEIEKLTVLIDFNKWQATDRSIDLLGNTSLVEKWKAFGWKIFVTDGHSNVALKKTFKKVKFSLEGTPTVILAKTTKGKGVSFLEGHGSWHHKIPNQEDKLKIISELN